MLPHPEGAVKAHPRCRRATCQRPTVGRGLCAMHYGRWQLEQDPLDLPGDTAPAPPRTIWRKES